jgi:thiamine-phosphate pyrophosphorylase
MITAPAASRADDDMLVARARAAALAGVHFIQIRQPDRDARPLIALATRVRAAVAGSKTRVVINDRVDVALASDAHGVHLRGDSMPASRVRPIVPAGFLIGRSVHSAEEAAKATAAGGLDYLVFGTVFGTASKPGARPTGATGLRAACDASTLPVLAVGGISAANAGAVADAGAAGFAAIGLFMETPIDTLHQTVDAARSAFDAIGAGMR